MIKKNQQIFIFLQKMIDLSIMFAAVFLGFYLRFNSYEGEHVGIKFYLVGAVILTPIYLYICVACGLYKQYRRGDFFVETARIFESTLIMTAVVFVILFISKATNVSRLTMILFALINISSLVAYRFILRIVLKKIRARGYNIKHILLIGSKADVARLDRKMRQKPEFGYNTVKYNGEISEVGEFLKQNVIDEVYIYLTERESRQIKYIYVACEKYGVKLNIIPSYTKYLPSRLYIDQFDELPIINIREIPLENVINSTLKRIGDIIGSLLAIIILAPIGFITAIIIKIDSRGPIIYKQERMGLNKKKFYIYKFRSMSVSDFKSENICGNEEARCTKFGKFIRMCSIDEIPQFVNVLKGDMSLVGPRPEIPELVEKYREEIPIYMMKHKVKCGMTGLAQIKGFIGRTSIAGRIKYDMKYIETWSLWLDLKIIILTIPSIIRKKHRK